MSETEIMDAVQTIALLILALWAVGNVLIKLVDFGPYEADRAGAERLQEMLDNEAHIRFLQEQYKEMNAERRLLVNTSVAVLKIFAPLTSVKSDDLLVELGRKMIEGAEDAPSDGVDPVPDESTPNA